MCNCIAEVNEKLAEKNTRLTEALVLNDPRSKMPTIMLQTELIEKKRGARPMSMFLNYCPFCGVKYEETT